MALKAGTVASFPGSLAEAMDKAMKTEWQAVKGVSLPSQGEEDRRLLFAAIAQGIFDYLKDNENQLINNISLEDVGIGSPKNYDVTQLELNL
ncbi:MAG: hypothetical protein ACRERV_05830 [Methylococcales bacterium]